ncbi:pentatricopeptide repeat-containing protein [Pyrus ussuriensis x Pyrus communis]|uniref:Pentatricopeptide repeat-containing protein n=1 Tax=Pyrus ussuriensis x Pyrus communis TaxID=2448454 RepID=A0A5N5HWV8_9ROSA|nr:pentatricopeptide repeat-containing protein [Pyrus ussuriensis x Pyrus communis]
MATLCSSVMSVDELKHKLLCKIYELDTVKMMAKEEVSKNEEIMKQLFQLWQITCQERDEARTQLQKLVNKLVPSSIPDDQTSILSPQLNIENPILQKTLDPPMLKESDSNFVPSQSYNFHAFGSYPTNSNLGSSISFPGLQPNPNFPDSNNLGFTKNVVPLGSKIDLGSVLIDNIARVRPLPKKGRLMQAVMETGPLLQTLLVAPLPKWRNPPPLPSFKNPPALVNGGDHCASLVDQKEEFDSFLAARISSSGSASFLESSPGFSQIPSSSMLNFARGSACLSNGMELQFGNNSADAMQFQVATGKRRRKSHSSACSLLTETQKAHTHSLQARNSDAFWHARQLFDETPDLSVVSATTIIGQFARQHRHEEAIYLFCRMLVLNIRPNEFTFGTVIHSSTALGDLSIGKQLHACATKTGLHSNVFVGSAILDLYAKLSVTQDAQRAFEDTQYPNVVSYTTLICAYLKKEKLEDALLLFREMPERNVVSWNAMIGGYSQTGHNEEAVNLFAEMLRDGLVPTHSTFPCAIIAAANIAALGMGRSFHTCAVKFLGKLDVFIGNSLISFYAKCGSMEDSLLVFDKLEGRNIVSWNAVICGYAQNGKGEEAIGFFERMRVSGCRPNSVTLLGLLWACNHAGLVDEGYSYFNQARTEDSIILKPEHYACMVDLLSRSGCFTQAEEFICNLPFEPGIGFWKALLGGCQIHSNTELGEFAARKILDLDPEDVSSYVMVSNAHCAAGRWQSVSTIRREMKEKGLRRVPGCSWIEVRNKVHVFVSGDKNHLQLNEIFTMLTILYRAFKGE